MATNDVYKEINALVSELGTAAERRREIEAEISDLTAELAALDQMAEDASDRQEYESITTQRREAELDIRFARNKLRLFDQTPRVSREQLKALLAQLSEEAEAAAMAYRKKVEKPMAEVVKAGDEFDAAINMVRGAVCKLASVTGPAIERDSNIRRMFADFELGKLRSRAYMDNRLTVHPDLRDALALASTAKQPPFRVC
jgi:chromosome segregation ATPase